MSRAGSCDGAVSTPVIRIELHQREVGAEGFAICWRGKSAAGSPADGRRVPQADRRDVRPSRARERGRTVDTLGSGDHPIFRPASGTRNTGSEHRVAASMR